MNNLCSMFYVYDHYVFCSMFMNIIFLCSMFMIITCSMFYVYEHCMFYILCL